MDGWMDGWIVGWLVRWMDGSIDRWKDSQTHRAGAKTFNTCI